MTQDVYSSLDNPEQEIRRLKKINAALMDYVERSTDQQGNAYSLFQTAINLESQIRLRTEELTETLKSLEQSNRELQFAKDAAEDANVSKTRFLAAASHDLLQPLNAAHLLMSSLSDIQPVEESKELVSAVQRSLNTIDDLLRSLLDISKLDAGEVSPVQKSISIAELFYSLKSDFAPLAQKRNLDLRFRVTEKYAFSDKTMLRRILQNLISNALRYTPDGGVLVGCRTRGDKLALCVVDTGIGIHQSRYTDIFEEFHRGKHEENFRDNQHEGLGLGLSIVQRMIKTLEHELVLKSRTGQGSNFTVVVPLGDAEAEKVEIEHRSRAVSRVQGVFEKKILVIENDLSTLYSMESLLTRWHCDVASSRRISEALARIQIGGWVPDVIIADQQLDNNERGTDLILAVRNMLGKNVPALMVTADPTIELSVFCDENFIELIRKPVKPAQLRAVLTHSAAL